MKENKYQPSRISTCFEESTCAEMMQKVMSEQGIGSLCEEMMRSLMKTRCEEKEATRKTAKEESQEKDESSNKEEV
jgi:hypothetical protein